MPKPAARKPFRLAETALVVSGIACAGLSAQFAITMISNSNLVPTFSGLEYLGIFAKPSHPAAWHTAGDGATERDTAADPGIDFTPVSSLPPGPLPASAAPSDSAQLPVSQLQGYSVRGVYQSKALLLGPAGFMLVREGTLIPGIGTVRSVNDSFGRWTIVMDTGAIIGR